MINGAKMRNLMDDKKITHKDLARYVGVSTVSIYNWISGNRQPRLADLVRISKALDCTVDDLLIK